MLQRDLVALLLAAGEPGKAKAILAGSNPTRECLSVSSDWWGTPGAAFQLGEAHRAEGDLDAARRCYQRALESAEVFDEVVSQKMLSQQERWEEEYGLDAKWLSVKQVRALPAVIRVVAQRRLEQLGPAAPSQPPQPRAAPGR